MVSEFMKVVTKSGHISIKTCALVVIYKMPGKIVVGRCSTEIRHAACFKPKLSEMSNKKIYMQLRRIKQAHIFFEPFKILQTNMCSERAPTSIPPKAGSNLSIDGRNQHRHFPSGPGLAEPRRQPVSSYFPELLG